MAKKKAKRWHWSDEPPRGAVAWLSAVLSEGRRQENEYLSEKLKRIDDGELKLTEIAKWEADHGASGRAKDLLRIVLGRLPAEERAALRSWIERGDEPTQALIERMRASDQDPNLLASLLCGSGRYEEEGKALLNRLIAGSLGSHAQRLDRGT